MFTTINGVLLNTDEINNGRTVSENDVGGEAGCKVWFKRGGWTVVPDITVEQLQDHLDMITAAPPVQPRATF